MVEGAKSFFRDNSTLLYFLLAQAIGIGAAVLSITAYMTKLEVRVLTMETRGAEYTVARLNKTDDRITILEQKINKNENSIERVIDVMTKELRLSPTVRDMR